MAVPLQPLLWLDTRVRQMFPVRLRHERVSSAHLLATTAYARLRTHAVHVMHPAPPLCTARCPQFCAIININLAVVNTLPLPALDGGYMLLLAVEALRGGKKLPEKFEQVRSGCGCARVCSGRGCARACRVTACAAQQHIAHRVGARAWFVHAAAAVRVCSQRATPA